MQASIILSEHNITAYNDCVIRLLLSFREWHPVIFLKNIKIQTMKSAGFSKTWVNFCRNTQKNITQIVIFLPITFLRLISWQKLAKNALNMTRIRFISFGHGVSAVWATVAAFS